MKIAGLRKIKDEAVKIGDAVSVSRIGSQIRDILCEEEEIPSVENEVDILTVMSSSGNLSLPLACQSNKKLAYF